MMKFKPGTDVYNSSHEKLGTIEQLVIDPRDFQVTHVVVRKGFILTEDKVIPSKLIEDSGEDYITLRPEVTSLDSLPPFEDMHYVQVEDNPNLEEQIDKADAVYWYPPLMLHTSMMGLPMYMGAPVPRHLVLEHKNIPEGSVPLKENTRVISSEGEYLGHVEHLYADPSTDHVTHAVISKGVFLKEDKLIPIWWIDSLEADEIRLAVSYQVFESLPSYEPDYP